MSRTWVAFALSRVAKSNLQALAEKEGLSLDDLLRQMVKERLHRAGINVDV